MGSPASHGYRHPRRGGSLPMESVAALLWNQRQPSHGIGGRLAMESVAAFVWNRWQLCCGISGRIHLESVAALPWNTQLEEHRGVFLLFPRPYNGFSGIPGDDVVLFEKLEEMAE